MTVLETIAAVLGIFVIVAGFLWWHVSERNKLQAKIHEIELKLAELKSKDELQQYVIDRLTEIFDRINDVPKPRERKPNDE